MTQSPIKPAHAGRIFVDASTIAAFSGHPPNKFTRLVEAFTRDIPGALIGTMTSEGFLRQDIVSFDTTPGYKRVFFGDRDAQPPIRDADASFWARAKLYFIVALLRIALPGKARSSLRNVGAYILAQSYRSMSNSERLRRYVDFEIDDPTREAKFAWWLKSDVEAARGRPFFQETKELIEVTEEDIVVFYGLAGGIPAPNFLTRSTPKPRYKIACILLDISPLLSPGITDRSHTRAAKNALRDFAEASELFIVPSQSVGDGLRQLLDQAKIRCPDVSIVNTFLGLSPDGTQSKVSGGIAGRYALTVMTFKRRKNAYWLLSAWKLAARAAGGSLPHLVIVSSTIDEGYGWLLAEDEFLRTRVTVVKSPTDKELRWLFTNASFVIQPPAQGGLGIAAMEAIFFRKKVLCERHPANIHLREIALARRLDLDMDSWVSAIVEECADPNAAPHEPFARHTQYARRYAADLMACLDSLNATTRLNM